MEEFVVEEDVAEVTVRVLVMVVLLCPCPAPRDAAQVLLAPPRLRAG